MQTKPQPHSDQEKLRALPWYLVHGVMTNIFYLWTFGGSVFLLFLSELGLPKGQIGTMLSLFPFCGVLALGFAPVATRLGRKRVYLFCYGIRYFIMIALLLLPQILTRAGHAVAVAFLFGDIIIFAALRALAETAYYPWTQEFIPNSVRGKFTAVYTVLVTIASGVALVIAGYVIGAGKGLERFLLLLAMGCFIGFIGILVMRNVPGGEPKQEAEVSGGHLHNMLEALRDGNFVAYLGGMAGVTIGTMLLTSFLPLYVKDQIGLASGIVVGLDSTVMVGGALSSLLWGWVSDRVGSRPVLMPAVMMCLLIPIGWILLPRAVPNAVVWCAILYFTYGVISNGISIGAGRLVLNGVIPPEKSTAYTAIYYTWMGLTGGIAPLLAGGILSTLAGWQVRLGSFMVDGYKLLFFLSLVLLAFGLWQYGRVRPDDVYTTRTAWKRLIVRVQQRRKPGN